MLLGLVAPAKLGGERGAGLNPFGGLGRFEISEDAPAQLRVRLRANDTSHQTLGRPRFFPLEIALRDD